MSEQFQNLIGYFVGVLLDFRIVQTLWYFVGFLLGFGIAQTLWYFVGFLTILKSNRKPTKYNNV
jgi:hypothetical protein